MLRIGKLISECPQQADGYPAEIIMNNTMEIKREGEQ